MFETEPVSVLNFKKIITKSVQWVALLRCPTKQRLNIYFHLWDNSEHDIHPVRRLEPPAFLSGSCIAEEDGFVAQAIPDRQAWINSEERRA